MNEKGLLQEYIYEIGSLKNRPSCHASNIIELPNKKLLAVWWAGAYEKSPDVAIYGAFLDISKENSNWSEPKIIVNTLNKFNGTPVSYLTSNGDIVLFFRVMHHGRFIKGGHTVTTIQYIISKDLGENWSDPKYLRKLWGYVIRGKSLRIPSGRVLLPFHRELFTYQSRFYINDNPNLNGKWQIKGRLKVAGGCLEPSITVCNNNSIICSLRTFKAKQVYFSFSFDEGNTWSKPEPSSIPNPNSQTDVLCLKNGHLLLVCNPLEKGRNELSIFRSLDYGKTWETDNKYVLEKDEDILSRYSYPCIIQTQDQRIHVTYTYLRKTIKHVEFFEKDIFN